jgi:SAM-dependent methyltransferase
MTEQTTRTKPFLEALKWRWFDFEDYLFEKRHRLDLGGVVPVKDLMDDADLPISHASTYHAVWSRNLRELFREARRTGHHFDNFVDIGSGKGKACFYAHTRQPFRNIVGVEFSSVLVGISRQNQQRFGADNIAFVNADATGFNLPAGNNIVFMFNPFDDVILERFIKHNLDHFRQHRSVIAYANDVQRMTLAKFGFEILYRNQERKISLHRLP